MPGGLIAVHKEKLTIPCPATMYSYQAPRHVGGFPAARAVVPLAQDWASRGRSRAGSHLLWHYVQRGAVHCGRYVQLSSPRANFGVALYIVHVPFRFRIVPLLFSQIGLWETPSQLLTSQQRSGGGY